MDRHLFQKGLGGAYRPFNDEAEEFDARVKVGEIVDLKPSRVRNSQYHKLFFAMLKLISDNSAPHLTPKEALYYAKMAAGVGRFIPNRKTGGEDFCPGSISFAKMDQVAFEDFVQRAIPPLCVRFMHGTAPEAVINEAMSLAA